MVSLQPKSGFIMTAMNKGWIDSGDILALTNKEHAPHWYSKVYIIEDIIRKLSGCNLQ